MEKRITKCSEYANAVFIVWRTFDFASGEELHHDNLTVFFVFDGFDAVKSHCWTFKLKLSFVDFHIDYILTRLPLASYTGRIF